MASDPLISRMRNDQEHDEAQCLAWLESATEAHKIRVWDAVQNLGGTVELELVSRFAQLGMTHAVLLAERMKK